VLWNPTAALGWPRAIANALLQHLARPEKRGHFLDYRNGLTIPWTASHTRGAAPRGKSAKAAQFHPVATSRRRCDSIEDRRDDRCNVLILQGRVRSDNFRDEFGSGQSRSAIGFAGDAGRSQCGQRAQPETDPATARLWWHTS
jgi:hypothetical protein